MLPGALVDAMLLAPAIFLGMGKQIRVALDALGLGDTVLAAPVVLAFGGGLLKRGEFREHPTGVVPPGEGSAKQGEDNKRGSRLPYPTPPRRHIAVSRLIWRFIH